MIPPNHLRHLSNDDAVTTPRALRALAAKNPESDRTGLTVWLRERRRCALQQALTLLSDDSVPAMCAVVDAGEIETAWPTLPMTQACAGHLAVLQCAAPDNCWSPAQRST